MKKLYFVDSIHRSIEPEVNLVDVTLIPTEAGECLAENGDGEEHYPIVVTLQPSQLQYDTRGGDIQEGWYVYYNDQPKQRQLFFTYANHTVYAQREIKRNDTLRSDLLNLSASFRDNLSQDELDILLYRSEVTSYHVNVGHGNCSLILIRSELGYQLWMVDCSIQEGINKVVRYQYHKKELEATLADIAATLDISVDDLRIHRFFLTHMHYDHYNGMMYLIRNGLINAETICYLNLYYQMASKKLNNILEAMKNGNVIKIVEPLMANGKDVFQILHPECHITRSLATSKGVAHYRVVKNVNNSSIVVRMNLGVRSMTFTGDIEQDGYREMSKCISYPPICFTDYYAVSHHGSLNGHPPYNKAMVTPFFSRNYLSAAVLMGRDGAYYGIFSNYVINELRSFTRLYTTSDNNGKLISAIKIYWQRGSVRYV